MKRIKQICSMRKALVIIGMLLLSNQLFAGEVIKVACIGDSITAGVGARDRKTQTYPAQLGDILGDKYQVVNFGISGIKMTNYMKTNKFKQAQNLQPNIVIIKLGTNDTKDRDFKDSKNKRKFDKNYTAAASEMIKTFKKLKSKPKIFICHPVPVFKSMGAINEKSVVEDIIPLITKIAKKNRVPIIDLYKAFAGKGKMVPDGVHPNQHGYKVIAETIAAEIKGKKINPF